MITSEHRVGRNQLALVVGVVHADEVALNNTERYSQRTNGSSPRTLFGAVEECFAAFAVGSLNHAALLRLLGGDRRGGSVAEELFLPLGSVGTVLRFVLVEFLADVAVTAWLRFRSEGPVVCRFSNTAS